MQSKLGIFELASHLKVMSDSDVSFPSTQNQGIITLALMSETEGSKEQNNE